MRCWKPPNGVGKSGMNDDQSFVLFLLPIGIGIIWGVWLFLKLNKGAFEATPAGCGELLTTIFFGIIVGGIAGAICSGILYAIYANVFSK